MDLSLDEGRETNYPGSINLDQFQSKVERQLGGSILDRQIQGRLLLLMYRKMCQMSTTMKTFNQRQEASLQSHSYRAELNRLNTETEYTAFVQQLSDRSFRDDIVSWFIYVTIFLCLVKVVIQVWVPVDLSEI